MITPWPICGNGQIFLKQKNFMAPTILVILLILTADFPVSYPEIIHNQKSNFANRHSGRFDDQSRRRPRTSWREPAEDWDEEKQLALALQLKVIRKMSMKKWIKERHVLWPSRPAVQRLKVEEWEESRMNILRAEGWVPLKEVDSFPTAQRTNWIRIAGQLMHRDAGESREETARR